MQVRPQSKFEVPCVWRDELRADVAHAELLLVHAVARISLGDIESDSTSAEAVNAGLKAPRYSLPLAVSPQP